MRIAVYYLSGKVSEFNTETFCAAEPFRGEGDGGSNIATEFNLRLDRLESDGLILQVYWHSTLVQDDTAYTAEAEAQGRKIPHAMREPGRYIRLVSKQELQDISKIELDGEMVVWRQGTDLINVIRFRNMELLCYSDPQQVSVNARVLGIWAYLRNAYPNATDEELAARMGYPLSAIHLAQAEELAQLDDEDDQEDAGQDSTSAEDAGEEEAEGDGIGALMAFLEPTEGEPEG